MEKLISIAIPSFNMEAYLERCLDSLIIDDAELMSALDILVVNDGSTDRTSEIAHRYADRYPDSITVIDKPNGHYGSCINAALPRARGKYFRILDADDWFDNEALKLLVEKLKSINTDVVFTKHTIIEEGVAKETSNAPIRYEEAISLNSPEADSIDYLCMHQLTYRTAFLKDIKFCQAEGVCYTDTEYVSLPMQKAVDIYALDISLYQYFLGREEQSMSVKSRLRNRKHFGVVGLHLMSTKILGNDNRLTSKLSKIYLNMVLNPYISLSLLSAFPQKDEIAQMRNILSIVKNEYPLTFASLMKINVRGFKMVKLWYKYPTLANILLFPLRYYRTKRYSK